MSEPLPPETVLPTAVSHGRHPAWLLGLAALLLWQGWMTLGLFDPGHDWRSLLDEKPILSGRHPLHLYHGSLGARTLVERGGLTCYDPAFHAGYPKTPVFDPGSRPAELAMALAGGQYSPAAYKVGLACFCMSLPLTLYLVGRGVGCSRGVALLATALGTCLFWGRPGRECLDAGDVDLLLAGIMLLAQSGLLISYHHAPGILNILGVGLTGILAWFAHPLLSILAQPLFLLYYLTVGHRHRILWHLPLFAGLVGAVGANAFWLNDLVRHWWIRVPPSRETPLLAQRNLQTWWHAPLWGDGVEKALVAGVVLAAILGVALMHQQGRRPAARLFGLAVPGFLVLAVAGISWEPFARLGSCQLLAPALLFAAIPASTTVAFGMARLTQWSGTATSPLVVLLGIPLILFMGARGPTEAWGRRLLHPRPLEMGLGEDREALFAALRDHTDGSARVLWEDRRIGRENSRWSALLPLLTGRAFVGGLDAESGIEHASAGLVENRLAGRNLEEWTDQELEDYCKKYNVGWIVCWSETVRARFARWGLARPGQPLPAVGEGRPTLFVLNRPHSYALTGSAQWQSASARGILLSDVRPQAEGGEAEGEVVLSLHYQAGMRVRPTRVRLDKAMDSHDTIPFIRLRMREPVGRILITWEGQ